jgi:hypothetical protein
VRRKAKVDDNQPQIVKEVRAVPGFTVTSAAGVGDGFPDLVVGYRHSDDIRITGLYEVKDPEKTPSRRKLTQDQKEWHGKWLGHAKVITTSAEIVNDMRQMARRMEG